MKTFLWRVNLENSVIQQIAGMTRHPLTNQRKVSCQLTNHNFVCSGWLWITSPGTSGAIAEAAQQVKFFWIDDVWVTGKVKALLSLFTHHQR